MYEYTQQRLSIRARRRRSGLPRVKLRRNITISPEIMKRARELMRLRAFSDFAGFLEALIREEWERRYPPGRQGGKRPKS